MRAIGAVRGATVVAVLVTSRVPAAAQVPSGFLEPDVVVGLVTTAAHGVGSAGVAPGAGLGLGLGVVLAHGVGVVLRGRLSAHQTSGAERFDAFHVFGGLGGYVQLSASTKVELLLGGGGIDVSEASPAGGLGVSGRVTRTLVPFLGVALQAAAYDGAFELSAALVLQLEDRSVPTSATSRP